MATIIREWIFNADDTQNKMNFKKLEEDLKGKVCERVMKNKKVCGRPYHIWQTGFCGCRLLHEDYSHAIQSIKTLDEK